MKKGDFVRGYKLVEKLGSGSSRVVWKVIKDRREFAMKVLDGNVYSIEKSLVGAGFLRSCPFLVSFIESFKEEDSFCLVMEYCAQGDLQRLIENMKKAGNTCMPFHRMIKLLIQLVLGLFELHKNHILHRDIKAENVFIDVNDNAKIGDFGISVDENRTRTDTFQGTMAYVSPQVLQAKRYDSKADIWGLGVVAYLLCTFRLPFSGENGIPNLLSILEGKYKPIANDSYPSEVLEVIHSMLTMDPELRPSAQDILGNSSIRSYADKCGLLKHFPPNSQPYFASVSSSSSATKSSSTSASTSADLTRVQQRATQLEKSLAEKDRVLVEKDTESKRQAARITELERSVVEGRRENQRVKDALAQKDVECRQQASHIVELEREVQGEKVRRTQAQAEAQREREGRVNAEANVKSEEKKKAEAIAEAEKAKKLAEEVEVRLMVVAKEKQDLETKVERILAERSSSSSDHFSSSVSLVNVETEDEDEEGGDLVGHCQIKSRIAKGGNGTVYRATDIRDTTRRVAVKFVEVGGEDPAQQKALDAELRVGLQLSTKCSFLVAYEEIISTPKALRKKYGPGFFLAMEFCAGGDLSTILAVRRKPSLHDRKYFTDVELLLFVAQVGLAIRTLHSGGMVHRDLKPENIFLTADRRYKVGDFSIARAIDSRRKTTSVLTTIGYAAPEFLNGDNLEYTTDKDIYSFGCILLEFIDLCHPFATERGVLQQGRIFQGKANDARKDITPIVQVVRSFALQMIDMDPEKRPLIQAIFQLPVIVDFLCSAYDRSFEKASQ